MRIQKVVGYHMNYGVDLGFVTNFIWAPFWPISRMPVSPTMDEEPLEARVSAFTRTVKGSPPCLASRLQPDGCVHAMHDHYNHMYHQASDPVTTFK